MALLRGPSSVAAANAPSRECLPAAKSKVLEKPPEGKNLLASAVWKAVVSGTTIPATHPAGGRKNEVSEKNTHQISGWRGCWESSHAVIQPISFRKRNVQLAPSGVRWEGKMETAGPTRLSSLLGDGTAWLAGGRYRVFNRHAGIASDFTAKEAFSANLSALRREGAQRFKLKDTLCGGS